MCIRDSEELVVAASKNEEPKIKIYNHQGVFISEFLAMDKNFRGGLNISLEDLDNNGLEEIIVTPASAGRLEVKVFDYQGSLKNQFFVAGNNLRGGLNVAAGDLDGKGQKQIVVAFGLELEPQVRIFNSHGNLLGVFLAYEKNFRGGVNLAVANLDGRKDRGKEEIVVAPGPGRQPQIKVFDNHGRVKKSFLGYNSNWVNGVHVAAGDINSDGLSEIILSAYPGGAPHVRIFSEKGIIIESCYTYPENFSGGIKAEIIKINN